MSEFFTNVVKIGPVLKHPNADQLEITNVYCDENGFGGYPCIIKAGSFKQGDLAVYISVDALCPTANPVFSFLKRKNEEYARIKAVRLRGIFSMGILVPAAEGM